MAGTVTCTVLDDQNGFRIFIDWTGATHPTANLKVERIVSGTANVVVRGAYAARVTAAATPSGSPDYNLTNCSQLYLWDFEAPCGVDVQYRVTEDNATPDVVTSTACRLACTNAWLIDPIRPCHNIKLGSADCPQNCPVNPAIFWISHDRETYAAVNAQFNVVGKRRPIDVSNVRRDAVTVLNFATLTCEDRDALLDFTAPGSVVYIPAFDPICWPSRYVALGDHQVSPVSRDLRRQERVHTIPAVVVDAPSGSTCCVTGTSWAEMCTCAATWTAMDALAKTGRQILEGAGVTC